jgi:ADP-glucose pyrophosphorylase
VEEGVEIDGTVLMQHSTVRAGAKIYNAIIGEGATIEEGAVIGAPAEEGKAPVITVVGPGATVQKNQTVPAGAIIDREDGKKEGTNHG